MFSLLNVIYSLRTWILHPFSTAHSHPQGVI